MSSLQNKKNKAVGKLSAEITEVTNYLQQRGDIKQAILFGSLATGLARPDSDIDIAILASQTVPFQVITKLVERLMELTGRDIDLHDMQQREQIYG